MKSYCPIPEVTQYENYRDITAAIADLFASYGAKPVNCCIWYNEAFWRIQLPEGPLEFGIQMPDMYDWLFYHETPGELREGHKSRGEDYEPLRCFPSDVEKAWHQLLLYRVSRLLVVLGIEVKRIEAGELTLKEAFPTYRTNFSGHCDLTSIEAEEEPALARDSGEEMPF